MVSIVAAAGGSAALRVMAAVGGSATSAEHLASASLRMRGPAAQ
jgi:hypothetical protein